MNAANDGNSAIDRFAWRGAREEDIPALLELMKAAAEIDRPDTLPSAERVRHLLGLLGDAERSSLLAVDDNGAIIASAFIFFPPEEDAHLAMFDGVVHPAHRQTGLGTHTIRWIEERAQREFGPADDGLPRLIRAGCPARQTDRIALFEGCGFHAARYAYRMERGLERPIEQPALPAGMRLERWSESLDPALMEAFNEAFRGHWGLPTMNAELWRQFITGVPQFRDDMTTIALDGESVTGFCVNWVNAPEDSQPGEGWVEAIGIVPAWRGRGLAAALLGLALTEFQAEGLARAALDVDAENPTGALRLYQKLGFEVAREHISFVKKLE